MKFLSRAWRSAAHVLPIIMLCVGLAPAAGLAAEPSIEGTYEFSGTDHEGGNAYKGVAHVQKHGDTVRIAVQIEQVRMIGTGLREGDMIAIVFKPLVRGSRPMVGHYRIVDETIRGGAWTVLGAETVGVERWRRDGEISH